MIPDPSDDPIPSEGGYGWLARLVGLPLLERVILSRLERLERTLVLSDAEQESLRDSLTKFDHADDVVDEIEKDVTPSHGHSKKGTKP